MIDQTASFRVSELVNFPISSASKTKLANNDFSNYILLNATSQDGKFLAEYFVNI